MTTSSPDTHNGRVVSRYRLALAMWLLTAGCALCTIAAAWANGRFTITAAGLSTLIFFALATFFSVRALFGPKLVRVRVPDSSAISSLIRDIHSTRRVLREVTAEHERVTGPRGLN